VSAFQSFTALHVVALFLVGLVILLLVSAGRAWRGTPRERKLATVVAVAILALRVGVLVWNVMPERWSLGRSLPLQICDLAAIGSALALLTERRWLWSIAYFWGLALSMQGLVQPDLAAGPASLAFWLFWIHHALIVGAALYVVMVRGFRPEGRDLLVAIGAGVLYVAVVFPVDLLLEANYGYLGRGLPSQPTVLDWLGPWPWRVVAMVALGLVVMVLLYLPWHRGAASGRATRGREAGHGGAVARKHRT
jgi:hypothetical integral membrane protein (TIGR02206 family)